MKKLFAFLLAMTMVLGTGAFLSACSGGNTEAEHVTHYDVDADGQCDKCKKDMPDHTHIYSKAWSTDAEYHWHRATCAHNDETEGKGKHTFESGVCTVCGMFDLTPVAPVGGVYTFEAENAVLEDPESVQNPMVVEVGRGDIGPTAVEGASVTDVGYFGGTGNAGQTITWKFTAATAGKVTIKLHASSAVGEWSSRHIDAIEMGTEGAPSVSFNGTALDLSGKTIGKTKDFTQEELEGDNNKMYWYFTDLEIEVNLVAGENTLVLTSGEKGCNPDKITIETAIELTFVKTNNTGRIS